MYPKLSVVFTTHSGGKLTKGGFELLEGSLAGVGWKRADGDDVTKMQRRDGEEVSDYEPSWSQ